MVFAALSCAMAMPRAELGRTAGWQRFDVVDLTDNETAKLHIRYMVGDMLPNAPNEKLFRFEFPERPGALLDFLKGLSRGWNISLFITATTVRRTGACCRCAAGPQGRAQFRTYMQTAGYAYSEETDAAYRLFARAGDCRSVERAAWLPQA